MIDWWMDSLQSCHNGRDGVSNHQPHDCLLNRLIRRGSKKTSKLRVTGLCAGKSPVTGEFPAQMDSNAENVSIWWRNHVNGKTTLWNTTWYVVGGWQSLTLGIHVSSYSWHRIQSTSFVIDGACFISSMITMIMLISKYIYRIWVHLKKYFYFVIQIRCKIGFRITPL